MRTSLGAGSRGRAGSFLFLLRYSRRLQLLPHFFYRLRIHIFLDLVHDRSAVHFSYAHFALIHIDEADKAQDSDHKPYVKTASGGFLFLLVLVETVVDIPVPRMYSRNIRLLIIQFPRLPQEFTAAHLSIVHVHTSLPSVACSAGNQTGA